MTLQFLIPIIEKMNNNKLIIDLLMEEEIIYENEKSIKQNLVKKVKSINEMLVSGDLGIPKQGLNNNLSKSELKIKLLKKIDLDRLKLKNKSKLGLILDEIGNLSIRYLM